VKLLIDQNLSQRLVPPRINGRFPGSAHVRNLGMKDADDRVIWDYAKANHWVIVTKDGDFHQMSLVFGAPPQVVWLRLGNSLTKKIARFL
jgi:predicted nuclease of predicted toxin-antitoxin system